MGNAITYASKQITCTSRYNYAYTVKNGVLNITLSVLVRVRVRVSHQNQEMPLCALIVCHAVFVQVLLAWPLFTLPGMEATQDMLA